MSARTTSVRIRRRAHRRAHHRTPLRGTTTAAAAGLAALALVLGACGEEGTAEEVVGTATSAAGSVAAEATSAVGDAAGGDGSGEGGSGEGGSGEGGSPTGEEPAPGEGGEGGNPDEEFLNDLRRVGVDVPDEQDYLTRGRDACASLDGGTGYTDVLRQYGDAHPDAPTTEAPAVVGAAVKALCSQHLPQIGQG